MNENNPGYKSLSDDLLSIDINSQIKKIAANTFTSESHYPVELIHSALIRQADKIEVFFLKGKLVVKDNGKGICQSEREYLKTLFNPRKNTTARESAINYFLSNTGIGMLALFAAPWDKIIIENYFDTTGSRLVFNSYGLSRETASNNPGGTTVTIFSKTAGWKAEEELIKKYCSLVKAEIYINNQKMEKSSLLYNSLVRLKLGRDKNGIEGEVSIPSLGEVSRILLLDRGIPWFHTSIHPWNGYVFQTAVEWDKPLSKDTLKILLPGLKALYDRICEKYLQYPDKFKERIDNLIFKHHTLTGSHTFLAVFRPFRLQDYSVITYFELLKLSREKKLFAVYEDQNNHKNIILKDNVMVLSRRQSNFLINQKKVKINFLSAGKKNKEKIIIFFHNLKIKMKKFLSKIIYNQITPVNTLEFNENEGIFLRIISEHLKKINYLKVKNPALRVVPVLIKGRGLIPAFTDSDNPASYLKDHISLYIRRKHPLVKQMILAVARDRDNIAFFIPFLPEN